MTVVFGPSMYFEVQNLPTYEIILDAQGSKGGYHLSLKQSKEKYRCHVGGQILSLTTSYSFKLHSMDFGLKANDLAEGTAFDKAGS